MAVDIDEFETPERPDYPRANGSPMVMVEGRRKRMGRTSNFAKPLDDESALTNWRIDTACFGVAGDKALQARYVSTKRDDRKAISQLREDAIQAGRGGEAAAIGTAIHAMSERWEDGDDDFDPPEPYLSALKAYSAEMERLGLVSEMFEFQSVTVEYSAAGTADRLYRLTRPLVTPTGEILPEGELIIGDIKTSKTLEYSMGAFAAQLSLYAQGQLYDVVNEEFLPTPSINQDWGVIAWIPSNQEQGHCEMIWVDLQAGNEAAWLAHLVKEHRKKWRKAEAIPVPDPVGMTVAAVAEELGGEEVDAGELVAFAKLRISAFKEHGEAFEHMVARWPEGLPKPKDVADANQALDLNTFLDTVETRFEMQFLSGDPRVAPTQPRRR